MDFRPPVTLTGRYLDLVPLELGHSAALARVADDPEIWRYWRTVGPNDERTMDASIRSLLAHQAAGTDLAFTVVRHDDATPVGMTRFLDIQRENDSAEVGGTWFARAFWRTPFNTESKRLMLGYAFDIERCHRVQIKTDVRNLRSQRAIERIGATREGVLREHFLNHDGARRSSVYYSVLSSEWPAVRARLDAALARPWMPLPRAAGPA